MINKIIILYCNISKYFVLKYLATKKLLNKKVVYFKNKDFQEEVFLDEDYCPHYITTYAKAINIDANAFNVLRTEGKENCEKPFDFSISIKKAKK